MKKAMGLIVLSYDLERRLGVYDGFEQELYSSEITIPDSDGILFTGDKLLNHEFAGLKNVIGDSLFDEIVNKQGFLVPAAANFAWKGSDNLGVSYFFYAHPNRMDVSLVLAAWGEFQPMRYRVNIEGIWHLQGLDGCV